MSVTSDSFNLPSCLARYFSDDEFSTAVKESKNPLAPKKNKMSDIKEEAVESDSEPSCDNFEFEEMKNIFQDAISEDELEELQLKSKPKPPPAKLVVKVIQQPKRPHPKDLKINTSAGQKKNDIIPQELFSPSENYERLTE